MFLPSHDDTGLDSIYTHDPAVVSNKGLVLGNMGKAERAGEPRALGEFCRRHDIPILGAITGEGRLEGGDVLWLDERTVAVGEGYRSNAEGIRQLGMLLGGLVDNGPDEIMRQDGGGDVTPCTDEGFASQDVHLKRGFQRDDPGFDSPSITE